MKLFGPFDILLSVYITDGEQTGQAEYRMPRDANPTIADFRKAAATVEKQVQEQMGEDWRLCTKREYFDAICQEMTGPKLAMQFAMPGSETEWDES